MPKADRVRASRALALRASGASWSAVAEETGYADRDSARVAALREERRRGEDLAARAAYEPQAMTGAASGVSHGGGH